MRIFIEDYHCPGDTLEDTAAIRDLCTDHPEFRVNVRTTANELWDNNPHLDRTVTRDSCDTRFRIEMPLILNSNANCQHSIDIVRDFLSRRLDVFIRPGARRCDVHLYNAEKDPDKLARDFPQIDFNRPYWLVNAGGKRDYTCKIWDFGRFQDVITASAPEIQWVQVGAAEHDHRALGNCVNLLGRTQSHRDLLRLMYRAAGVLCGVTYLMHMASMETPWPNLLRPCVVIAGGREPPEFSKYPGHAILSTVGELSCCRNGGCWMKRVSPLHDGDDEKDRMCLHPVKSSSGQVIPLCMHRITAVDVYNIVMRKHRAFMALIDEEAETCVKSTSC